MCIANERPDRRSRWPRVLANLAMVAGLLLWNFGRSVAHATEPWFDATVGLLMGVSIGMNLLLVVRARRCNRAV